MENFVFFSNLFSVIFLWVIFANWRNSLFLFHLIIQICMFALFLQFIKIDLLMAPLWLFLFGAYGVFPHPWTLFRPCFNIGNKCLSRFERMRFARKLFLGVFICLGNMVLVEGIHAMLDRIDRPNVHNNFIL